MKKNDPVVTESRLEVMLDERFQKFTKILLDNITKIISFEIQKAKDEIDENAQKYRDQIVTREDKISSELEEHRVERLALKNDVENLQKKFGN